MTFSRGKPEQKSKNCKVWLMPIIPSGYINFWRTVFSHSASNSFQRKSKSLALINSKTNCVTMDICDYTTPLLSRDDSFEETTNLNEIRIHDEGKYNLI